MSLPRRGFIQGVFGGVTAVGLLIRAQPEVLEPFVSPMKVDEPLILAPAPARRFLGQSLYNEHGDLVAYVDSVDFNRQLVDVTRFGDVGRIYVSGLPEGRLTAVIVGPVELNADDSTIRLKGVRRR